jgi:radical SAM protein with 4Fe4S-binding SPASM domain
MSQSNVEDDYDRIVRKTIDACIPFKVDWEITHRCNLKCQHCYEERPAIVDELSTKEACAVIDQLAAMGALFLTFTGGEILLRKDFMEIATYARKKDFALRLFTNGTLIDKALAKEIKALDPLAVEISLYGMNPLVHDAITGVEGSYYRTIEAFYRLKREGVNTIVKTTVMNNNYAELSALKQFAESINARFVYSLTVVPQTTGTRNVTRYRLTEEQLERLYAEDPSLTAGITEGGVQGYDPLCAAGVNSLYIAPNGDVFPCMLLLEKKGNVKDASVNDIWNMPYFQKLRGIRFEDLGACAACSAAAFCDRCAGLAALENNDLYGKSPHDCTIARIRKEAVRRRRCDGTEKDRRKDRRKDLHTATSKI